MRPPQQDAHNAAATVGAADLSAGAAAGGAAAQPSARGNLTDYLVTEPPLKALLILALPMILGNLFQQVYNLADSLVVGHFVGQSAVAAVGASYSLTNVFVYVANGAGVGAAVLTARYFGAHDDLRLSKSTATSLTAFLALSVALAGVGLGLSRQILTALNVPAAIMGESLAYLNVYFVGLPFLFMYNVISSMFNALGDSRTPLALLIFSSVFNVALDVALVGGAGLGVAGVAWATFIAQGISAVVAAALFARTIAKMGCLPHQLHATFFSPRELRRMVALAIPSILQQSAIAIGLMLVQSVVNGFGEEALAGFSAAMRIENIATVPTIALGAAISSFTAQNIGARRLERIDEAVRVSLRATLVIATVIFAVYQLFCEPFIRGLLGSDFTPRALAVGVDYMRYVGWFYVLIGAKNIADGTMRGTGSMAAFTIANIVNLGLRVGLAFWLAPIFGVQMTWVVTPLGWLVNFAISFGAYKSNLWREKLAL